MRELGFRAYIKPLKRYATGIDTIQFHKCCDVAGAGIWSVVTANEGIFDFDDIIIEQDTGLKDENGKEIYEGDIVTLNGEWEEIEYSDCAIVTFEDGCFRVGDGYENEAGSYLSDWRIIGNIHENPELIKEE